MVTASFPENFCAYGSCPRADDLPPYGHRPAKHSRLFLFYDHLGCWRSTSSLNEGSSAVDLTHNRWTQNQEQWLPEQFRPWSNTISFSMGSVAWHGYILRKFTFTSQLFPLDFTFMSACSFIIYPLPVHPSFPSFARFLLPGAKSGLSELCVSVCVCAYVCTSTCNLPGIGNEPFIFCTVFPLLCSE